MRRISLVAKVIFSRLILDGGQPVNPRQEVEIVTATDNEKTKLK
ncbi:MAG TPA: hypothetical protein VMF08_21420 [Candidatus Sulfotelmatobacter sp.]|nr:hypothetical protein [Candidatus Sulfotelmatobacter sp.]